MCVVRTAVRQCMWWNMSVYVSWTQVPLRWGFLAHKLLTFLKTLVMRCAVRKLLIKEQRENRDNSAISCKHQIMKKFSATLLKKCMTQLKKLWNSHVDISRRPQAVYKYKQLTSLSTPPQQLCPHHITDCGHCGHTQCWILDGVIERIYHCHTFYPTLQKKKKEKSINLPTIQNAYYSHKYSDMYRFLPSFLFVCLIDCSFLCFVHSFIFLSLSLFLFFLSWLFWTG